ncbi:hypothetical protein C8J57DRAFT_1254771 [Mycena rebaudengoi]|nr:hypothetical protein C8J57DRAFT_1254771 [Mycena rebaudengoi]
MKGMEEELHEEGVTFLVECIAQDPADCTLEPFNLANFTLDPDVAAVLCGLDTNINYTKLSKAFQYLTRNPGCAFLATNEDSTYPAGDGLLPGAGSISAPLRYAVGKDPTQHRHLIRSKWRTFDPPRSHWHNDGSRDHWAECFKHCSRLVTQSIGDLRVIGK